MRDLAEFLEIYGLPVRLGKYPAGASDKEKTTLLNALVGIGHNAAGIIPETMMLELLDAASGSGDTFMSMVDWCERTQSKIILGGTLTTQADGKTSTKGITPQRLEVIYRTNMQNAYMAGRWQELQDNRAAMPYAKSVGKWFQTDDATRLQYLALALESVTGGFKKPINWKTMDNSFLQLTPELLREIMQTMHDDEQADFANAEKHKAAMLKAENPLEYDYSGGWTTNYEQIEDGESDK